MCVRYIGDKLSLSPLSLSCSTQSLFFFFAHIYLRKSIISVILIWRWGHRLSVDKRRKRQCEEEGHAWFMGVIIEAHCYFLMSTRHVFSLCTAHLYCRNNLLLNIQAHMCNHLHLISLLLSLICVVGGWRDYKGSARNSDRMREI